MNHIVRNFLLPLTLLLLLGACQMEFARQDLVGGQCQTEPQFEAPEVNACAGGERIRLAFVGDVLLHWQLQKLGYARGFSSIWAEAAPYLSGADIAVANLEGPVAPGVDRRGVRQDDPGPVYGTGIYTGYPAFNYHPVILRDLARLGVDVVTTANNHAMDRRSLGADLTLEEVAKADIDAVGTIRRGAARDFVLHRRTSAGKLAFIACSFSTNGIADPHRQVLMCYKDRAELLALVRREAADISVAGVIVLPHWGQEYTSSPDGNQRALARDLAAAGATAIIGTHPHAVQPFTLLDGPQARIPVAYSTGNFIAVQDDMPAKVGALALLDLCRGTERQGLVAARFGWIAMQMELTPQAYWVDIAPPGTEGAYGLAYRHLSRISPGYSAQPAACE